MSGPALLQGVFQGPGNVFLADDFGEPLRTVFACQNLITHGDEILIIRGIALGRWLANSRFDQASAPPSVQILAEDSPGKITCCCPVMPVQKGAAMQLKLSTRTSEKVLIVDCAGRIVFGEESAMLRDTIRTLLTENKYIVLNLSGVNYIDSGGLGTLVSLYTTAKNAGGGVKLANLTQRVDDLLQVTKLVTVFDVYDNEETAAESFRAGAAA
jgi:anti-sigma B factor antagonist